MKILLVGTILACVTWLPSISRSVELEAETSGFVGESEVSIEAHQQLPCGNCHRLVASLTDELPDNSLLGQACRDCHHSQPIKLDNLTSQFHGDNSRSCVDCHSFHALNQITAGETSFKFLRHEKSRYLCRSCHNSSGGLEKVSDAHWAAKDYYHRDSKYVVSESPSATCQSCHGQRTSFQLSPGKTTTAIHINSSASHPIGMLAQIGTDMETTQAVGETPLLEGKVECQTCHLLNSGVKSSLVNSEQEYGFCFVCHPQGRNSAN